MFWLDIYLSLPSEEFLILLPKECTSLAPSEEKCSMIGYFKVHFAVWHSNNQTTLTIKTPISFEYMYPYIRIPIWHTYILKNIVEATELGTRDLELCIELGKLVFRFQNPRPRHVPSSMLLAYGQKSVAHLTPVSHLFYSRDRAWL